MSDKKNERAQKRAEALRQNLRKRKEKQAAEKGKKDEVKK